MNCLPRNIKRTKPAPLSAAPILAMSANAFTDDIALSREAGMNEHLSKSLEFGKMMETIAKYRR